MKKKVKSHSHAYLNLGNINISTVLAKQMTERKEVSANNYELLLPLNTDITYQPWPSAPEPKFLLLLSLLHSFSRSLTRK